MELPNPNAAASACVAAPAPPFVLSIADALSATLDRYELDERDAACRVQATNAEDVDMDDDMGGDEGSVRTDSESGCDTGSQRGVSQQRRCSASGTNADSSESSREDEQANSTRSRKPTYLVRKEEKEALLEEIRLLEARSEMLRAKAGLPTRDDKLTLAETKESNQVLEDAIHHHLLGIGRVNSLISRHIRSIPVNPMKTFIHLTANMTERRETLRALRDRKLQRAHELATERLRFIDHAKPYLLDEHYFSEDGGYNSKRFEIQQFEGLKSVKELYDILLFYLSNMEISITDTLGHVTIREDMEAVDPRIWNHRVVSATGAGYVQEVNTVGFTEFHERFGPLGGQQYGVVAQDAVEVDDLYPYRPHERIRKDVTAALTVSGFHKPITQELVVVLKRCVFLKIHKPAFALPASVEEELRDGITTWCNVMSKFLRDTVTHGQ